MKQAKLPLYNVEELESQRSGGKKPQSKWAQMEQELEKLRQTSKEQEESIADLQIELSDIRVAAGDQVVSLALSAVAMNKLDARLVNQHAYIKGLHADMEAIADRVQTTDLELADLCRTKANEIDQFH